jgi:hypothetical protein
MDRNLGKFFDIQTMYAIIKLFPPSCLNALQETLLAACNRAAHIDCDVAATLITHQAYIQTRAMEAMTERGGITNLLAQDPEACAQAVAAMQPSDRALCEAQIGLTLIDQTQIAHERFQAALAAARTAQTEA